ncbi:hypothetical protein V6N11_007393 [Hibiscus sabdariffa]|uniref:Uncharacterized protein n=2 Tax=Hibiscus sabdariffa TaxID=183260 RepID=A0ABR2AFW9_9ROSI
MRLNHIERSEFEEVGAALRMLLDHKAKKSSNTRIQNLQTELGKLDQVLEDVEQELECLYRDLIKARVTLLNTLKSPDQTKPFKSLYVNDYTNFL